MICPKCSLHQSSLQTAHGQDKDSNLANRFAHICVKYVCMQTSIHKNWLKSRLAKALFAPGLICSLVCSFIRNLLMFGKYPPEFKITISSELSISVMTEIFSCIAQNYLISSEKFKEQPVYFQPIFLVCKETLNNFAAFQLVLLKAHTLYSLNFIRTEHVKLS